MSKFYVQQKLLSSNSRTIIKDEKGTPIFLLVGRWGTRGDALSLYQMNGEIVASIKQVSFVAGSRFDLYKGFEKVGTLQKILSFNRDFYYIHHLNWVVLGNISEHHYSIYQLGRKVMEMEETILSSGDFYALSVEADEDAPLCICIAAVLNYWLRNKKGVSEKLGLKKPQIIWGGC